MLKRFLYLTFIFSAGVLKGHAQEREADLKAVFIYNFINYIDWDSGNDAPNFVIGIIGSSEVTRSLSQIAAGKTAKNKRILIHVFSRPEDIQDCQILFIPQNLPYSLQSILDRIDKGVLTISEETGYAEKGTAFNFFVKNDKLKFEANLKALDQAGLKAGSQLLKLAKIVNQ
ncbi:MAG TPA: YfiR family protein [Puia sp.]|nr:YfiR family protein [Puia sp.]